MSYLDSEMLKAAGRSKSSRERLKSSPPMLLKIIVVGSSNVGKTSLMKRYVNNEFSSRRRSTVGADFMTKEEALLDQRVLLQIWDTAGQERFHGGALGPGFYRGASAALIVYDVTSSASLNQVGMWREELLEQLPEENKHRFPIVVLANKVDLAQNNNGSEGVNRSEVANWCASVNMGHLETSAKDGHGVQSAMICIAMLALEEKKKQQLAQRQQESRSFQLKSASHRGLQSNSYWCCA